MERAFCYILNFLIMSHAPYNLAIGNGKFQLIII